MNAAVRMLEAAALRYGERCAIEDEHGSVTYREYDALARSMATGLLRAGANRRPIIVYLRKSIPALAVFAAAQYCGCPYAPVDAHIPMVRLEKIIQSLRPGIIVTDEELSRNLERCDLHGAVVCLHERLAQTEADNAALEQSVAQVIDSDPIYIMYTSGSTGAPKGVTIPHRGIIDYADWVVTTFGYTEETVMANQAPLYFDNSTFDIYGCMKCGAKLVLIPDSLILFPLRLPEFLAEKKVTSIFWVPTVLINVAASGALDGAALPDLKTVAFCGEVMPCKHLNIWRRALPHCTYANLYGPTEITDVCCYYMIDREFSDSDVLPLGRACENMRVLICREDGSEAAVGEQGELCVLGSGVALGYWNAAEQTRKAFVRCGGAWDERMYRTGDLAYRDGNGLLQFCGRKDSQIKWKGNRIELGEIEAAAMCVDGVENTAAVFLAREEKIVLFVETRREMLPSLRRFNMQLKERIPQYMLPHRLIVMDSLPHTANDKIDRVRLRTMLENGEV